MIMENGYYHYTRINLNPGELYIATEPTLVWTLLGSCVAISFYNARLRIGAICHAQVAEERHREYRCSDFCPHPCFAEAPDSNRFKYVACSIRYMYERFTQFGISGHEITVKLFGGANMFSVHQTMKSVGEENIEVARKMINDFGLRLVKESVGGKSGRTLYFYSDTGEILLKITKHGK